MELFKIVPPEALVSKNSGQYFISSTSIVPKMTFIIMTLDGKSTPSELTKVVRHVEGVLMYSYPLKSVNPIQYM